jgi:hypothetical protein
MDFVTGLWPTPREFDCIAVIVDRLTKYVHFVPTTSNVNVEDTAYIFLKTWGTQSRLSTAYHPQTDGQTERTNRVLECYLRTFILPTMNDWDLLLPAAAFACNNSLHSSISNTPFYLNNGRHPRMPFMAEFDHQAELTNPAATELAKHLQETINRAENSLRRQQAYYNRNRPEITFKPNQLVLLNTKNFAKSRGNKLMPKWMGPFVVQRMVGPVAVKLRLPESMRCHNVFHVSLVKLYRVPEDEEPDILTPLIDVDGEGELIYKVETIAK